MSQVDAYDKKLTVAKENFTIQLKTIEKEVKADLSSGNSDHSELFKSLRQELEVANKEVTKHKKASKSRLKAIQIDLDAHVDAVTLLREMGDKYKAYADALILKLKEAGVTQIPEMPKMSMAVQEHQEAHESESESESMTSDGDSMTDGSSISSKKR